MNWGNKIAIVIVVFIVGMLSMVMLASKQSNTMYDDNYYTRELAYQNTINASTRLNELFNGDLVAKDNDQLSINIPAAFEESVVNMRVECMHHTNNALDKKFNFESVQPGQNLALAHHFSTGSYLVRIYFTYKGVNMYKEQKILI